MPKSDPLFSLRRLALLALAAVLCCLALAPSVMACCTEGATQVIVPSIACCTDPPTIPTRTAYRQTCHSCVWVTTSTFCQRAPNCAF
jgi:hypothetical protein